MGVSCEPCGKFKSVMTKMRNQVKKENESRKSKINKRDKKEAETA